MSKPDNNQVLSTNPLGVKIAFTKFPHGYKSDVNGVSFSYTSVTTLTGKYFEPFPAKEIAKRTAIKRNMPVVAVLAEWNKTKEDGCRLGTRTHAIVEDIINGVTPRYSPESPKEIAVFKYAAEAAIQLKDRFLNLTAEKIVFDHRLKIAGTIDLLIEHHGTYIIIDWKTSKEIHDNNLYNNFGLGPLAKLADTPINRHSLQLSCYEYLLKQAEYIPSDATVKRVLMHVTENGVYKYMLDDMTPFIKDMIIDYMLSNLIT